MDADDDDEEDDDDGGDDVDKHLFSHLHFDGTAYELLANPGQAHCSNKVVHLADSKSKSAFDDRSDEIVQTN